MPTIRCPCGKVIDVEETQAGERLTCDCGALLNVPTLTRLRYSDQPVKVRTAELAVELAVEPADDESVRDVVMMLTTIEQRISQDAMGNFMSACERILKSWEAELGERDGFDIQMAVAMIPNGQRIVDVAAFPDQKLTYRLLVLKEQIEALPAPEVVAGPVAFLMRRRVCEGSHVTPAFDFPFGDELKGDGYLDDLLMKAAGGSEKESLSEDAAQRPRRSIWAWLSAILFGEPPSARLTPPPAEVAIPPRQLDSNDEHDPNSLAAAELHLQQEQFDEAIRVCSKQLEFDPANAQAHYLRGIAYSNNGQLQKGLADQSAAIECEPSHAAYRAGRAEIYFELGAIAEAEADLNHAIQSESREPSLYVRRSHCRLLLNRHEEAMADVNAAIQLDPHSESCFVVRGLLHLNAADSTVRQAEMAEADFTTALEIAPENPYHHAQRARAFVSQGKYEMAVADCDHAVSIDSQCGLAYGVRGYAEQQLERFDEVIADCSKAIELGFVSTLVYVSRAVGYHSQGETDLAIADCDAALEMEPDSAIALNYRGVLRMSQGDVEAAMEDFGEAGRLAPEWSMPRGLLADTHRMQSEYERAIEDYTKAIELDPADLAALVNRALCWIDLGKYENAMTDLAEVISRDPDLAAAYLYRAQLFLHQEQEEQAMTDLDKAISADPEFADAYHIRAQLLQSQDRIEEAMRDYNRLIELSPDSPDAFIGRANAWIQMGNDEKVSDDYHEAMQLAPDAADSLVVHRLLVEAQHLHQKEDYDEAIERATEAIERDSDCLPAYSIRAGSHWYAEQWVEAVDDFSKILGLDDEHRWVFAARGQVYAEMGESETALNDLNRAMEFLDDEISKGENTEGANLENQRAYALNGRGLAQVGLRKFDDAEIDFAESIRLCPDNAWVHYNRGLMFREQEKLPEAKQAFQRALECDKPALTKRKRERTEAYVQAN